MGHDLGPSRTRTNQTRSSADCVLNIGGAEGDRTPDLRIANATLSQLSYGPEILVRRKIIRLAHQPEHGDHIQSPHGELGQGDRQAVSQEASKGEPFPFVGADAGSHDIRRGAD